MTQTTHHLFNQDLLDFFTINEYLHNPHEAEDLELDSWLDEWLERVSVGAYDLYPDKLDKTFRSHLICEAYDLCVRENELHIAQVSHINSNKETEVFYEFAEDLNMLHDKLYEIKSRIEKASK